MNGPTNGYSDKVRLLREEFDGGFAVAPKQGAGARERFLAVRVASRQLWMRVTELAGVIKGAKVSSLPTENAAFLGIIGVRGELVPVYDLSALRGDAPGSNPPPLIVLCKGADSVGLAVDAMDGYFELEPGDVSRTVVSIPDVVKQIQERGRTS